MSATKPALIVVLLCTALSAFGQDRETRDLKGFTSVSHGISGELVIKLGDRFDLVLEGSPDDIDRVTTEVKDNRLIIRTERWSYSLRDKVNVYVTMPEVEGIILSGSGKAIVEGAIEGNNIDLVVSGSGKITVPVLKADNTDCVISGSGNIEIKGGKLENLDVTISGSGNLSCADAMTDMMDITISGSGSCSADVRGSIDARVSGSGNIWYKGDPSIDARISGSGKVRKMN